MAGEMRLWRKVGNKIQCVACNHFCLLGRGERGICGVRESTGRSLKLLVMNRPYGIHLDPIEKKPLFHFRPGSKVLSFGTVGCNFRCPFCQNWFMSQEREIIGDHLTPSEIVRLAIESGADGIAYTYNEPTVFAEFAIKTMEIAKRRGLFNVWVSNGFMSKFTRHELKGLLDAINIDLKGDKQTYEKVGGRLEPVLENIRAFHDEGVWVEVTTLVIPGENDSPAVLEWIAKSIAEIDPAIPWHVTAFHPDFLWHDRRPTDMAMLRMAYNTGKKYLKYVYAGNIISEMENTFCPKCGTLLIRREGYNVEISASFENGKCKCGEKIEGVW